MPVETAIFLSIALCGACAVFAGVYIYHEETATYPKANGVIVLAHVILVLLIGFIILGFVFGPWLNHITNLSTLNEGKEYLEQLYVSGSRLDTFDKSWLEGYDAAYHGYKAGIARHPWQCKDMGDFPRYYLENNGTLSKFE